mmetsp:Transcript_19649/g.35688  ORF Transcript_19649/g.35688 Transcript_19649/m.35688 type:complete len:364 (+) Transcript_19649:80-1171(+)|eukprot:CAMPEP_0196133440 /NCGR_PEP_ID=MMETSP0910-20130528/2665_1 /TAXON_ID=49265 /ORGANISM="Thalassiosira rotula, Strain GSO102" /LENGTH=363 /DNA_ID=CAMNT_0041393167 /DNA_START=62 /DNA_END=1153 /DNA_ORIENTATION=+
MKLTTFHISVASILFVLPTSIASSSETSSSFLRSNGSVVDTSNDDTANGIVVASNRGMAEDGTEEEENERRSSSSSAIDITAIHSKNENENNGLVGASLWPFHGSDNDNDNDSKSVKDGITFERTETACPLFQYDLKSELTMWQKLSSASLLEYAFASFLKFIPTQFRVQPSFFATTTTPQQPSSSPHLTFDDGHCESHDEYGGNVCHYDWGDDITINYDGNVDGGELDGDVYIEVSAKIDNLVHDSQTCPICGPTPCTIALSSISSMLPSSWKWSIDLPPCPLTSDFLSGTWNGKLPSQSPVPSLGLWGGGAGTVVEGTVWLKRRKSGGNNAGGGVVGADVSSSGEDEGEILMEVKGNVHLK